LDSNKLSKKEMRKLVWDTFHVKRNDNVPFSGWFDSTRGTIAEVMDKAEFKIGAEVGVCKGQHARALLRQIKSLETLILVDPWCPYNRLSQEKADIRFGLCKTRLFPYENRIEYMKMQSMEAVDQIEDGSLDFVYIDGLHEFNPVMMDIIKWVPKVRPGGIIAGHDYYVFYQSGIIEAVNAYTRANSINEWYITREKEPSWFWVKD